MSLEGAVISEPEKKLFSLANPFGFILFGRNIQDVEQLKKLTHDIRETVGWECPILIDQEGGRVQRMKAPNWPEYPAMQTLADDRDALKETIVAIAKDLAEVGIDVNCAPVLDVLHPQTHKAIGDRAFSDDPQIVAECGKVVCETFLEYGITPVMKHMPGHGRAACDSHKELPRVDADIMDLEQDFAPFDAIADTPYADQVWGMVGHVVYEGYGLERPATVCARIIDVIREDIGFGGLLLTDDLDMDAMESIGDIPDRAKEALDAGIDLALYCHGNLNIMEELAVKLPSMREHSLERYERSRIRRRPAA